MGYWVDTEIIDARTEVPQHRERIFLVGFNDITRYEKFDFPPFKKSVDVKPKQLKDILEPKVDERYTLSDRVWSYLQERKELQKAKGNGFGYGLAELDGITRTLSARYHKDGSEILIADPNGTKNPRRLTPRECARLMGFDNEFKIPVSDTQAYRQFGNSIVVPVIGKIAKEVLSALNREEKETRIPKQPK